MPNSDNQTTVYVLPTNSEKDLDLDDVSIKIHILDLRGNSLEIFPASTADDDGVGFDLVNMSMLGTGTYAIYLELLYGDHSEFYPNDSVKYITIHIDDQNNVSFQSMFTADSSNITPPQDTKPDVNSILHVHDINLNSIVTKQVPAQMGAKVYLDKDDNLIFQIPEGPTGEQGIQGPIGATGPQGKTGPAGANGKNGESAYQLAVDGGYQGSQAQWLASLKGPKGDKGDTGPQGPIGLKGPKGDKGNSIWLMKNANGGNLTNQAMNTLNGTSATNVCQVGDTVVETDGSVVQVTAVNGNTWSSGPVLFSIKGQNGKTPVKGTDYYTDADKTSIENDIETYVNNQIEKGKW